MNLKNITNTLLSKAAIIALNFLLVVLSTNLWGSAGRGSISILIADVSIIVILNNILGGSAVTYFTPKVGFEKLFLPAYMWIITCSFLGSLFFYFTQNVNFIFLFVLSFFSSLFSVHLYFFTAKENFKLFNIYSLLLPLLNIIFLLFFEFGIGLKSYKSYLWGYVSSLILLWIISFFKVNKLINLKHLSVSLENIKNTVNYGYQTELSYFIHFINYRISYFLILHYKGISSVGVFSIGIAIAEAIWVISRSISTVQYAKIINNINSDNGIEITRRLAKFSFNASIIVALILIIFPNNFYSLIFGKDFTNIKEIMTLLFPGITALALSNIHGNYFSATGQLKILVIKSVAGLIVTVSLLPILLPKWGIFGACIVTSLSYITSSVYLLYKFYKDTTFSIKDFLISKSDIQFLIGKNNS